MSTSAQKRRRRQIHSLPLEQCLQQAAVEIEGFIDVAYSHVPKGAKPNFLSDSLGQFWGASSTENTFLKRAQNAISDARVGEELALESIYDLVFGEESASEGTAQALGVVGLIRKGYAQKNQNLPRSFEQLIDDVQKLLERATSLST